MKKLLLILMILILGLINLQAQHRWNYDLYENDQVGMEKYVPLALLLSTFTVLHFNGENMTHRQRDITASVGFASAISTSVVLMTMDLTPLKQWKAQRRSRHYYYR